MAIGTVSIDVVAELARFRQDMGQVGKIVSDQMRQVSEAVEGIKGGIETLKGGLEALGVAFTIKEIVGFVKDTIEATARIKDQSEALGVSTQAYQALEYAAAATGTSQETLDVSVSRLTKTIGEAVAGQKQAVSVFQQLGVATRTASGEVRSTESVLTDVATALAKIPSAAERARIETELFGKSGQQLDSFMREGGAGIEALAQQAQNLGLVFDRDMIEKAAQAEGAIRILKMQWDAFAELLIAKLTPAITNLIKEISALFNLNPAAKGNFSAGITDELQTLAMVDAEIQKVRASFEAYYSLNAKDAAEEHQQALKHIADEEELNGLLQLRARVTATLGELGRRNLMPATAGGDPLAGQSHGAVIGGVPSGGKSQAQIDAEAMAAEVNALRAETEALAGNSDATKLNSALVAAHAKAGSENAAVIKGMVEGIQGMTQAQEADKKAWKEHTDEVKAADELMRSLEPKVDKLAEDQALLNQYLKDGVITQQEYAKASANVKTAIDAQDTATKKFNKELGDMASTMENDLGSALADLATGATTWQQVMSSVLKTVLGDVLKLIDASTGKSGGGGLLGILGNIGEAILGSVFGGGGSVAAAAAPVAFGSHAAGGHMSAGELSLVGERGAELWLPDTPGTVIPNGVSDAMMGGGMGGPTYHIDARGADSAAIARLEATLRELHRSIEPRAVAAVGAARKRGGTFAAMFAR